MFCFHHWEGWSDVSDTGCDVIKLQFNLCDKCHKVKYRHIDFNMSPLTETSIPAKEINELVLLHPKERE